MEIKMNLLKILLIQEKGRENKIKVQNQMKQIAI